MRFDVVLALLVSTYRAMRRPIDRGTSDRTGSALFRMYQYLIFSHIGVHGYKQTLIS